jgi:hypothetical protein
MDPNWGMLSKSAVDDETIEEAIVRLIQAHDDDEEAHLDTGQSLQSHKASDVIDHLAASIVEDKLADYNVTPVKIGMLIFTSFFESLDNYSKTSGVSYDLTFRFVKLVTSGAPNDQQGLVYVNTIPFHEFSWDKDRFFETAVVLKQTSNVEVLIGPGFEMINNYIYFVFTGGHIYGRCFHNGSHTDVDLGTYNANQKYALYFEFKAGVQCDFYVDNVLLGTISTNLPSGVESSEVVFSAYCKNLGGASKSLYLGMFDFRQKI